MEILWHDVFIIRFTIDESSWSNGCRVQKGLLPGVKGQERKTSVSIHQRGIQLIKRVIEYACVLIGAERVVRISPAVTSLYN